MCAGNQQEVSWLHQWMYRTFVCLWAQQSGSMRKSAIFVASSPQDIHSGKPVRDHIFDAAQVTHTGSSKWPRGGSMNLYVMDIIAKSLSEAAQSIMSDMSDMRAGQVWTKILK